jgi:ribosomal protein S18 acetylase RimI-like enzyme
METRVDVQVRPIRRADAAAIARVDASYTGVLKTRWWDDVVARHTRSGRSGKDRVGFVAVEGPRQKIVGYVLAQVRAFEFGSEPCGWIFAIGVHPGRARKGVATLLNRHATEELARLGVKLVRTMVRRDDVPVLTFFRSQGFAAGPYIELERQTGEAIP